jgi:hypothetical protein
MHIHKDELVRADNPLKKEQVRLPVGTGDTIDDVAW